MTSAWLACTLADLCDKDGLIQTGPFGSQLHAEDYREDGIPVVMPTNIGDNRVVEAGIARISEADAQRLQRHRLRAGDIVYSRRGDITRRALIGDDQSGWLCGTGCLLVRPNSDVDSRWLAYWLGTPDVHAWLLRHSVGATMANLNTGILAALPVTLPPAPEQSRIADALQALDDLIDSSWKLALNLRAAVLAEHDLLARNNLWSTTTLKDAADGESWVITGPFGTVLHAEDYAVEGVPLILVKNVMDGSINTAGMPRVAFDKAKSLDKYVVQTDDLVVTRVGRVGDCAMVDSQSDGFLVSGQMLRVRTDPQVVSAFWLWAEMNSDSFKERVRNYSVGSTRSSFSVSLLEELPIMLPRPIDLQRFDAVAHAFRRSETALRQEIGDVTRARDSILPLLLTGGLALRELVA